MTGPVFVRGHRKVLAMIVGPSQRHRARRLALPLGLALTLGGCSGEATAPSPLRLADTAMLVMLGFPAAQQIRTGESVLLSLADVPSEVESIVWESSDAAVVSVASTPARSPCGSACAWARGESSGCASVEARVCFVDGSCTRVNRARVSGRDGVVREVTTALSVAP